jgi:hypothetical protein
MYLHMLIAYNLTTEYLHKYVDTHNVTKTAVTILSELDTRLLFKMAHYTEFLFRRVRKIAKNHYEIRHVCLSVCPSVRPSVCRREQIRSH